MARIEALEKLASTGLLKQEPPSGEEIAGMLRAAIVRLEDARKTTNAPESRFDLAHNAAHAFSLAALRIHGYRTDKRYIVFQALPHTLGVDTADRIRRGGSVDEKLLRGLIDAALDLLNRVHALAESYGYLRPKT
jgi:hypothetical protein